MTEAGAWIVRNWSIVLVAVGGIVWGVRLEERMTHHLNLPYHDGMRQQRDDLIEIKAELRYLREDVLELKNRQTSP